MLENTIHKDWTSHRLSGTHFDGMDEFSLGSAGSHQNIGKNSAKEKAFMSDTLLQMWNDKGITTSNNGDKEINFINALCNFEEDENEEEEEDVAEPSKRLNADRNIDEKYDEEEEVDDNLSQKGNDSDNKDHDNGAGNTKPSVVDFSSTEYDAWVPNDGENNGTASSTEDEDLDNFVKPSKKRKKNSKKIYARRSIVDSEDEKDDVSKANDVKVQPTYDPATTASSLTPAQSIPGPDEIDITGKASTSSISTTPAQKMPQRATKEWVANLLERLFPKKLSKFTKRKKTKPAIEDLEYSKYLDDLKFEFAITKPVGQGAYDLRHYTMGTEKRRPTHEDVAKMQNTIFNEMQKDYSLLVNYFKQSLGMPTQKSLKAKSNGTDDPAEKRRLQQRYDRNLKTVQEEATLYNFEKVKNLAWEPELFVSGGPKLHPDKTLKGKYICQYENDNGTLIHVEVPTHWAKSNFGITALAHAQQFAYDNAKKGEYKIDADGEVINLSKYLNVEGKEVFLKLVNFAVNKVHYRPALKVKYGDMFEKDSNGNYTYNDCGSRNPIERPTRIIPEKGLCYSEKANKKIEVTYQYLPENCKQCFLDEVREAGLKKSIKYIAILLGRSVMPENIPIEIGKGPDQKHYQKEDESTCLTISFSNMLYY